MSNSEQSGELVWFRRRSDLPGVELQVRENSGSSWVRYSADYEFFVPANWFGKIWHRRREAEIEMGHLVCVQPGEVLGATQVFSTGTLRSLSIDATVLQRLLAVHERSIAELRLRGVCQMSFELRARLNAVFVALCAEGSLASVERALAEFTARLVDELVDRTQPLLRKSSEAELAERIRACLLEDPNVTVDLDTLARVSGLSRFQVVRVFKRRYGLPPHCYQLQRRLGFAQKRLRDGVRPAQVAMDLGFVDQSHLTRQFKRLFGVTPAHYARAPYPSVAHVLPFSPAGAQMTERHGLALSANVGAFSGP
jgi:AraC-like DNA-binding protein